MQVPSIKSLDSSTRISSIDVFRAFAILPVVAYHFHNFLPYGYLGVDLFFVISGFLVGSILIKKFIRGEKINFFKFFLQRGFKIWPSYYCFLIVGTLLASLVYTNTHPDYIINWRSGKDILRYLFFYQNYTGAPYHWTFDHVWSLCVEEHFYIMLPVMLLIIQGLFKKDIRFLFLAIGGFIVAGVLFKLASVLYTNSKDTYSGTLNRLDSLGWGVLLAIIISNYGDHVKKIRWRRLLFPLGLLLFALNFFIRVRYNIYLYEKIVFHSLAPFCFFLMILGVFYYDFSRWKFLRFVSYYTYNWYLWHPLFVGIITSYFGVTWWGLLIYFSASFGMAVLFTSVIEEPFLRIRSKVIPRLFKPDTRAAI